MPFAYLAEVIAVDGEDDRIGEEPGAPELGPNQEFPILQPLPAHKT